MDKLAQERLLLCLDKAINRNKNMISVKFKIMMDKLESYPGQYIKYLNLKGNIKMLKYFVLSYKYITKKYLISYK